MASLLLEAGIVVSALALAGAIAWRFGQSVIPAYLLVGVLIGPFGPSIGGVSLSLVEESEFIELFAELGIVFLLFFIGVEFSLAELFSDPDRILRAGGIDFLVNVGVGVALGFALGLGPVGAFFMGGVLYPSSSAVVTKSLSDLGWIADPESEAIIGTLVVEDVVAAVYLAALAAIALGGAGGDVLTSLAQSGLLLLGFVLLATVGGRAVERLFSVRSDELFLLRVVGATALLSGFALTAGVSEAVAAFFVGAAISETDLKRRLERVLAPARDLFAAVFFFAVGLGTDPAAVAGVGGGLLLGVAAGVLAKVGSGYLGGRAYGLSERRSLRVGVGLTARGEFSLVVAALAAGMPGAVGEFVPAFTVGYVLLTSVLGTLLMRYSGAIERVVTPRPG